jgi:hypothetical protein
MIKNRKNELTSADKHWINQKMCFFNSYFGHKKRRYLHIGGTLLFLYIEMKYTAPALWFKAWNTLCTQRESIIKKKINNKT